MSDAIELDSADERQTMAVGAAVAGLARAGDVIGLSGDLGVGKTRFVRGMAVGLGMEARAVSSPTFVIVHEYERGGAAPPLVHVDAYRLADPRELEELGWADLWPSSISAVEWADRVEAALGPDLLSVTLRHSAGGRALALSPRGTWSARMQTLRLKLNDPARSR